MVTRCYGDNFTIYTSIESYHTPETNIICQLYRNIFLKNKSSRQMTLRNRKRRASSHFEHSLSYPFIICEMFVCL